MTVNALKGFHAHPQVATRYPGVSPVLHEPCRRRMSKDMGRHVFIQPGVSDGLLEPERHALHRLAVDFDRIASALARPAAHVSQQPVRDLDRRTALPGLSGVLWASVEHTSFQVDEW